MTIEQLAKSIDAELPDDGPTGLCAKAGDDGKTITVYDDWAAQTLSVPRAIMFLGWLEAEERTALQCWVWLTRRWVTLDERSAIDGVSTATIRRAIERGLPSRREGRKLLVDATAPLPPTQPPGPSKASNWMPSGDAVKVRVEYGDGTYAEGALWALGEGYFASSESRQGMSARLRELCEELRRG